MYVYDELHMETRGALKNIFFQKSIGNGNDLIVETLWELIPWLFLSIFNWK